MTILLTEREVTELLDIQTAIDAVEVVVRDQAEGFATNRPRQRVWAGASMLHVMPGSDNRLGIYGLKAYSIAAGKARFMVLLYDAKSGDLLAMIEADRLGQVRTGAASGVATKYMAREDADTVGIFGTGWQAESQLMAVCAVRQIKSITAFSRKPENRRNFSEKMSEMLGVDVKPAESPEQVVKGNSILITATSAREPVLDGSMLEPGTHLNVTGANYLSKSEVDVEAIRRSSIIAVDSREQAKLEAGDLLPAMERGVITWEGIRELGEVVAGHVPGRTSADQITMFKSGGMAIWDIAAALRVYNLAREKGVGKEINFWTGE